MEALWDEEWRATMLETALARVKARVDPRQWQIFDLYGLKGRPVVQVAQALGVSVGRVYLIKHRISAAVKKELNNLERS